MPALAGTTYIAEELEVLDPGSDRLVRSLNDADEAVGGAGIDGEQRGIRLNRDGIRFIEGRHGSDYSLAFGNNDLGEIVGTANGSKAARAFRSGRFGGNVDLGTLPGDSGSAALAINHHGQAVGFSSGASGIRAVVWSRSGAIEALLSLKGSKSNKALAINERGEIVGVAGTGSESRAVLWREGNVQDLGALPGHTMSEALAISNKEEIAGSSGDPATDRRAVVWAANGAIQNLGTLPGGVTSRALSINNRGVVVGGSDSPDGSRAFVWTRDVGMQDLNDLVPLRHRFVLTRGVAVNAKGVILARGQDESDTHPGDEHNHDLLEVPIRVFLLIPQ